MNSLLLMGLLAFSLSSCSEEVQKKLAGFPVALSQKNEVIVVMDKPMWEGAIGDSCRAYFAGNYPILPQPEPVFDLKFFTPRMLSEKPVRKEFRTYIFIANMNDESSPTTRMVNKDIGPEQATKAKDGDKLNTMIGQDKWAKNQQLIYLFASSEEGIKSNLARKYPTIAKRLRRWDRDKVDGSVYFQGTNAKAMAEIKKSIDVDIKIPGEYVIALNKDNTIWLRSETQKVSYNLMLHKLKYTDTKQFTKESIKGIRDQLGKYVSTEIENTYMLTNDVDLPMLLDIVGSEDLYKVKVRGIWEIENDFMGGPFLGYLMHNPKTNDLLYIDGFIHAPGEKKRDLMQELEYIISSAKF